MMLTNILIGLQVGLLPLVIRVVLVSQIRVKLREKVIQNGLIGIMISSLVKEIMIIKRT